VVLAVGRHAIGRLDNLVFYLLFGLALALGSGTWG
jgi:hypothetical protein